MPFLSLRHAALALVAGVSLNACVHDDYSYGYGGYRPYGGVTLSYGNYYGWNDGYYYPGVGFHVYDRYRRPHRWNNSQRRYWGDRQRHWRGDRREGFRSNWSDYYRRNRR